MIKAKLYMNVHWMVLYKLSFFCSDMKFKMAATTDDHSWSAWFQLSKWFQRRSVLKHFSHRVQCFKLSPAVAAILNFILNMIKAKLYMNVHWMVLYKHSFFCSDMKFKMAATTGLSLTLDPILRWWPSWISDRHKKQKFVQNLPMIIPGQLGFNCPSGFREEAF
jgi:hypothetical protein